MPLITIRITVAVFMLLCFQSVSGQEVANRATPIVTAPPITATASAERVRFTAPSNVVRMQLQVISETGQILFEVSSKGNVLDWTVESRRLPLAEKTTLTLRLIAHL